MGHTQDGDRPVTIRVQISLNCLAAAILPFENTSCICASAASVCCLSNSALLSNCASFSLWIFIWCRLLLLSCCAGDDKCEIGDIAPSDSSLSVLNIGGLPGDLADPARLAFVADMSSVSSSSLSMLTSRPGEWCFSALLGPIFAGVPACIPHRQLIVADQAPMAVIVNMMLCP